MGSRAQMVASSAVRVKLFEVWVPGESATGRSKTPSTKLGGEKYTGNTGV